jgi:hypothetical protein
MQYATGNLPPHLLRKSFLDLSYCQTVKVKENNLTVAYVTVGLT